MRLCWVPCSCHFVAIVRSAAWIQWWLCRRRGITRLCPCFPGVLFAHIWFLVRVLTTCCVAYSAARLPEIFPSVEFEILVNFLVVNFQLMKKFCALISFSEWKLDFLPFSFLVQLPIGLGSPIICCFRGLFTPFRLRLKIFLITRDELHQLYFIWVWFQIKLEVISNWLYSTLWNCLLWINELLVHHTVDRNPLVV